MNPLTLTLCLHNQLEKIRKEGKGKEWKGRGRVRIKIASCLFRIEEKGKNFSVLPLSVSTLRNT